MRSNSVQEYRWLKGFTLIELMIVLFIVSMMSGIGIANLPRFAQTGDFDQEARRIKLLLDLAREESLSQAVEFGFKPSRDSYAFFIYNEFEQNWAEYQLAPFQKRSIPESMQLDLEIEKSAFALDTKNKGGVPPLLLLSSGEITPFTLTLSQGRELSRSMRSDGYGDIVWLQEDDE